MTQARKYITGGAALLLAAALSTSMGCGGSDPPASMDMATAAPTFTSVQSAITNKSCTTPGACHGAGTATMLSLGADAKANFTTITTGTGKNGPFINKAAPETSNFLVIPTDSAKKHNGAASWTSADKEYAAVLAWIKAGAPSP